MNEPSQLHAKIQSKRVLIGCTIESASPATAELAAMIGFDVIWADMEHHGLSLLDAQMLGQAAKAGGAMTILRVPSAARPHVLGGLERGADMIMAPMVESADTARQMVEFGKYKPLGNRGFVGSSRGVGYGLGAPLANMERANRESHLFVQIETIEGVKRCKEILSVEGISGAVIGPADLSVSMGKPLAFDDQEFVQIFCGLIRAVRVQNKIAVAATGNPALVKAAIQAGAQIIVTTGERPVLKAGWQQNLKDMAALIHA
ncbi:MAG: hypothetical protein HY360_16590 [Verrucomicrobia bacterium]|nr:hypothetical protein [Verrucomicrobiota bacterium]